MQHHNSKGSGKDRNKVFVTPDTRSRTETLFYITIRIYDLV